MLDQEALRKDLTDPEAPDEEAAQKRIARTEHTVSDQDAVLREQAEKSHFIPSRVTMFGGGVGTKHDHRLASAHKTIIFPWTRAYKIYWGFTVVCAIFTVFFESYMVAFERAGLAPYNNGTSITEYVVLCVFVIDIFVNFNLSYTDNNNDFVYDRKLIARHYLRTNFWRDFIGVFPFYTILLFAFGKNGSDDHFSRYLSLVRLVRLIRLHRVRLLFEILQVASNISLFWVTLVRNFAFSLVWTHCWACIFFFISRQYDHEDGVSFLGGTIGGTLTPTEEYLTVLYFSVVTFSTVGYGDFSPVNAAEQVFCMCYMLLNVVFMAWVIGGVTLLIGKRDEKTGNYRSTISTVDEYSRVNNLDMDLRKRMKMQLQLNFNNEEMSDEMVLSNFPGTTRRKILRILYNGPLMRTSLVQGIRQRVLDAFLASCKVEIFGPGEDLLLRGIIATDLYLLVAGTVELHGDALVAGADVSHKRKRPVHSRRNEPISDDDPDSNRTTHVTKIRPGDFINEISFFTETPQVDTIRTTSVVKTLTMSRSAYRELELEHSGMADKILENLLDKVERAANQVSGSDDSVHLPRAMALLRVGSHFDKSAFLKPEKDDENENKSASVQADNALSTIRDLVKMHIGKKKDDHTTRFLFAAFRGDVSTVALMCDQGFDPNEADYEERTALMVAAMKGNTNVVKKLFEYKKTNPNLVDMHGSSALYEAATNGHEDTMDVLLANNAALCMSDRNAAHTLCEITMDGDMVTLKRLLKAKIQVNAKDYDKRTAAHIAAAEGNLVALKTLVEFGADVSIRDRWDNTVYDEAKRANAGRVIEFLDDSSNK